MKNKINNITKIGMLLGLIAIAALCMVPPVHAGTSKSPHHGGSGGDSGGGLFYATVTNVTQLIADINYANKFGGTFTINLQPNTTFDLLTWTSYDGVGANLLPIIVGATNAVNLTIIGNGDTIQRDATNGNSYEVRLFEVAKGSSLTLDQMTLQNGYSDAFNGGAIYNFGTLSISNCTLSGNTAHYSGYISSLLGGKGGAIYNNAGTVIISDSFLSGNFATGDFAYGGAIYNDSGTVMISHSTISGNSAGGGVGGDASLAEGGGIYNNGTVTVENYSSISGNGAADFGQDVYNLGPLYLDGTSTIGVLDGYSAIPIPPSLTLRQTTSSTVAVSWPSLPTGFVLQQNTNGLGSVNWSNVTDSILDHGTNKVITQPTGTNRFFRLALH